MHVVFVLSGFFPENVAGTELYVLNLATNLQQSGFIVSVIIPTHDKSSTYKYDNIPVYTFYEESKTKKKIYAGLKPPLGLKEFKKLIIKLNPDVVHFHANNRLINSFHIKVSKSLGLKTVFTSHLSGIFCVKGNLLYMEKDDCNGKVNNYKCIACYLNKRGKSKLAAYAFSILINSFLKTRLHYWLAPQLNIINHKKKELKKINKYTDKIISISEWIQETYLNNKISSNLIPQAVQLEERLVPIHSPKQDDVINILFLGRISSIKGLHILLDAISSLQEHFNLIVAGIFVSQEHKYYTEIKKRVHGLKNHEWYENLPKEEVGKLFEKTQLLCLPSIVKEMSPLSLLEAFHFKVPVVGTNLGGIKDRITDGVDGLLFESGNYKDLKGKLELIINDRNLLYEMSKNIQIEITYRELLEQHIEIYSEL